MSSTADIQLPVHKQQCASIGTSPWPYDELIGRPLHNYQIYGISIHCEIPLSFAEHALEGDPDVSLFLASEAWFAKVRGANPPVPDTWYQYVPLSDGSDYVRWRGLFEFVVSPDGRSIACHKLENANIESFRTYLLGQVLSYALVKQGQEPLHATAVVVQGTAIAFLGDSGHGKSTLAAAFLRDGYPVLTDDLLLIREIEGMCVGFPGPARLKLFPEAARRFLPRQADGMTMNPDSPKLIIPLEPHQKCAVPVPVYAFYLLEGVLDASSEVSVARLSGRESLIELIRSTFNVRLINAKRSRQQFFAAQRLCARVPVNRITYPREFGIFRDVIQTIMGNVRNTSRETV